MSVTNSIREAAEAKGYSIRVAHVASDEEFFDFIDGRDFDIVWSALYHITPDEKYIGRDTAGTWVADELDARNIHYIGSDSRSMRNMIDKYRTHEILAAAGVPVPAHHLVRAGDDLAPITYPAFVKPVGESRSVGISDESVVHSEEELRLRAAYVEREFGGPALVEDFLPGAEYTVLVLGNGDARECLPGLVSCPSKHYGRHQILRSDLRGVGLTRISLAGERAEEARHLASRAAEAMNCRDHVRIDLRVDKDGRLRVIEVNGIPGLKPHKSWAPQIYTLYHASPQGQSEDYRLLIRTIIESARRRTGV